MSDEISIGSIGRNYDPDDREGRKPSDDHRSKAREKMKYPLSKRLLQFLQHISQRGYL